MRGLFSLSSSPLAILICTKSRGQKNLPAFFAAYRLASSCAFPMFFLYLILLLPNQLDTFCGGGCIIIVWMSDECSRGRKKKRRRILETVKKCQKANRDKTRWFSFLWIRRRNERENASRTEKKREKELREQETSKRKEAIWLRERKKASLFRSQCQESFRVVLFFIMIKLITWETVMPHFRANSSFASSLGYGLLRCE